MCRPWLSDREEIERILELVLKTVEVCTKKRWRERRPRRLLGCGLLTALLVPWPQLEERLDGQTCANTQVWSEYGRSWSCVSAGCSDLVQCR